jgi:phosphatidylglycerol---prolipoprotein diacylglyceryl transferase
LIDALSLLSAATSAGIPYTDLGLSPILLDLGWFQLRWYSLGYLFGIVIGWWYLLKLIDQPGAPMARRHVDDMVFYATLGIILGGRLGYVLFYKPLDYLADPLSIVRLWDGGMSFHGGVMGVTAGILWMARRNGLDWLRVHDYVACCAPFGIFLVRLANFVNSELWGAETDVPWAVRFCVQFDPAGNCLAIGPARHPSQIYEALLEGVLLFVVLAWMFWRSRARYQPGKLVGAFLLVYGLSRFFVEFIREADSHLVEFAQNTGLHMGQWLSLPMIVGGLYLIVTAKRREDRVRPATAESPADEPA